MWHLAEGSHMTLKQPSQKWSFRRKKNIILRYNQYLTTGAPRLSISIDVDIVPVPRKYSNSKQPMPTEREIVVKEQILEHKWLQISKKKTTKNKTVW